MKLNILLSALNHLIFDKSKLDIWYLGYFKCLKSLPYFHTLFFLKIPFCACLKFSFLDSLPIYQNFCFKSASSFHTSSSFMSVQKFIHFFQPQLSPAENNTHLYKYIKIYWIYSPQFIPEQGWGIYQVYNHPTGPQSYRHILSKKYLTLSSHFHLLFDYFWVLKLFLFEIINPIAFFLDKETTNNWGDKEILQQIDSKVTEDKEIKSTPTRIIGNNLEMCS